MLSTPYRPSAAIPIAELGVPAVVCRIQRPPFRRPRRPRAAIRLIVHSATIRKWRQPHHRRRRRRRPRRSVRRVVRPTTPPSPTCATGSPAITIVANASAHLTSCCSTCAATPAYRFPFRRPRRRRPRRQPPASRLSAASRLPVTRRPCSIRLCTRTVTSSQRRRRPRPRCCTAAATRRHHWVRSPWRAIIRTARHRRRQRRRPTPCCPCRRTRWPPWASARSEIWVPWVSTIRFRCRPMRRPLPPPPPVTRASALTTRIRPTRCTVSGSAPEFCREKLRTCRSCVCVCALLRRESSPHLPTWQSSDSLQNVASLLPYCDPTHTLWFLLLFPLLASRFARFCAQSGQFVCVRALIPRAWFCVCMPPPPSSPPSKKHECGIPNATLKEINTHRVHDLYSCDYFLTLYRSTSITFFGSSWSPSPIRLPFDLYSVSPTPTKMCLVLFDKKRNKTWYKWLVVPFISNSYICQQIGFQAYKLVVRRLEYLSKNPSWALVIVSKNYLGVQTTIMSVCR